MRAALRFFLLAVLICVPVAASAAAEKKPAQSAQKAQKENPVSLPIPPRFWGQWVFLNGQRSEFLNIRSDGHVFRGGYPKDNSPSAYTLRVFRDEIGYTLYAVVQKERGVIDENWNPAVIRTWTFIILDYIEDEYGPGLVFKEDYSCNILANLFLTETSSDVLYDRMKRSCPENAMGIKFRRQ